MPGHQTRKVDFMRAEGTRRVYRVGLRQDAWQHYTALVHAVSAKEACEAAMDRFNGEENGVDLVKEDISAYDDVSCEPEDDVELIEEEQEEEEWANHARAVEAEKNPPTLVGLDKRDLFLVTEALRFWGSTCPTVDRLGWTAKERNALIERLK